MQNKLAKDLAVFIVLTDVQQPELVQLPDCQHCIVIAQAENSCNADRLIAWRAAQLVINNAPHLDTMSETGAGPHCRCPHWRLRLQCHHCCLCRHHQQSGIPLHLLTRTRSSIDRQIFLLSEVHFSQGWTC